MRQPFSLDLGFTCAFGDTDAISIDQARGLDAGAGRSLLLVSSIGLA